MRLSLPLARRMESLSEDRASSARQIVLAASEHVRDWLLEVESAENHVVGPLLSTELDPLIQSHGWRAPVALWWHTIDRAVGQAGSFRTPLREVLIEEMGLWLGGLQGASEAPLERAQDAATVRRGLAGASPVPASPLQPGSGEPLDPGVRLPDRRLCVQSLLAEIEPGEVLVVPSDSETVAFAIERLVREGLQPQVILGEGGPNLGGRQMVRRLESLGVAMRLVYDAALPTELAQADRLWMGTEALGPASMIALKGTGGLIAEARRRQVPTTVFATSDKVMPGAKVELPAWAERESYLLWDGPSDGLAIDSQFYEQTPLDGQALLATEVGLRTPAQLALQVLRTES